MRRSFFAALLAGALAIISAGAVHAHHGWAWTTGKTVEITGVIKSADLGNPHGVLKVDIKGELWTVEVGQPWRNEKAGLKPGDLAAGVTIRVYGEPSKKAEEKRLKAVRVYIGTKEHNLYPERK